MKTSWPDPPPLFDADELDHPGEKMSWVPREGVQRPSPRKRSPHGQEHRRHAAPLFDSDTFDISPTPPQEIRMAFDEIIAQFAPVEGKPLSHVAVYDLETTGVDVRNDRIVTAFVGVMDEAGTLLEQRSWLADPGVEIPAAASAVHGISTEEARTNGRPAAEVVSEIVSTLRGLFDRNIPVVAYNAPFDFSMLKHEAERYGIVPIDHPSPVIDPLVVDKRLDKYRRGKRTLNVVAEHYDVALDNAHEASADAIATGRIALAIADRFSDELPASAAELHDQQVAWAREQAADLTQYLVTVGRMQPGDSVNGSWPIK